MPALVRNAADAISQTLDGASSVNAPTEHPTGVNSSELPLANARSFIETQFPVSRLSKESYKERKANYSQTLTGLGKWWGRKPLIMVRAVILGLLMPASNDPRRDRDVFLALLTMDEEGLWRRKRRNIPLKEIYRRLSSRERGDWFATGTDPGRPRLKKGTRAEEKEHLQRIVFSRMGYDEKLVWCGRPEHVDGPSPEAWKSINEHLGTTATALPELVRELGERRFGHVPRVGDAFCGGGSVPFEAARLGCEAFGSDLNPVAALLTWGALNIVGGGEEVAERVRHAQAEVFAAVDRQVTEWRIEHNGAGWRADAFLYCAETTCPVCGWRVPLAPSWVIGEKTRTVARLAPIPEEKRFSIDIRSGVSQQSLEAAREAGTVKQSRLHCPNPHCDDSDSSAMAGIRGDERGRDSQEFGLRQWPNDELVPRPDDVFQERLYCVRWRLPSLEALLWADQRERADEGCTERDRELSVYPESSAASNGSTTRRLAIEEETPVPPYALPAQLPDWVDLEHAICALDEWLGTDEKQGLRELRERNWVTEDRALEEAQRELDALKDTGCPKHRLKTAQQKVNELEKVVTQRIARVEALANSLPGALYRTVDEDDLQREERALALLQERFEEWQALGYVPRRAIAQGDETSRLMRERGWTHWHHLFTPRQLLSLGLLACKSSASPLDTNEWVACIFGLWKCCDRNSKLCVWDSHPANEKVANTFLNQAFNPLMNFGSRAIPALKTAWSLPIRQSRQVVTGTAKPIDARQVAARCDYWLTDPPYADAVNYHELSELLLSWSHRALDGLFPNWYTDSKPASCITFLSEQAFAPQNTRFWSRSRVWFQFTVGEDKPPMLSVDNRGKGVLSMDCSAKRSPF